MNQKLTHTEAVHHQNGMSKCQIIFFIIFQMGLLAIYSTLVNFQLESSIYQLVYTQLMDLNIMVFVGFGLIKVFLRNHSFSSIAYSLFLAVWTMQITILLRGAWIGAWDEEGLFDGKGNFNISLQSFAHASYGAATLLIAFGAVLGKVNAFQLVIMALSGVFFYTLNQAIAFYSLGTSDLGGAVLIHLFGACFGLACAKALGRKEWEVKPELNIVSKHSILFAVIGTLFLVTYFPSFNGLFAIQHSPESQELVYMNTIFAIIGSVLMAFVTSALVNKGRFNMEDIIFATFAGGVIVGTGAVFSQNPYACILAGNLAGMLSVLIQKYITPKLGHSDTTGTLAVHLIPGFLGGFFGMITLKDSEIDFVRVFGPEEDSVEKNEEQVAMIFITLGIALASGFVTGLIMRIAAFNGPSKFDQINDDRHQFTMDYRGYNHDSNLQNFIQQQITHYYAAHPQESNRHVQPQFVQQQPQTIIVPEQPGNQPLAVKEGKQLPL